jgi:hypothetical protein
MANITYFSDKYPAAEHIDSKPVVVSNRIDVGEYGSAIAAADTVEIMNLPAYAVVTNVTVTIVTAEGSTCTGDLGTTGGDPNGIDDAVDFNASAGTQTHSIEGTDALMTAAGWAVGSSADTLDLVLDHELSTTAVFVVTAQYYVPLSS